LGITVIGEIWLPTLICALFYWCVDMKKGVYLFSSLCCGAIFSQIVKTIACVYRPWILCKDICPENLAMVHAKNYSFPSGHSTVASTVLGGIVYIYRKKLILLFVLLTFIFLVGFSRLWLGVHTPQDVVSGLVCGFLFVLILNPFVEWAEKDKNRYLFSAGIVSLFAVLALIFICYFNSYRMDYVNGELLVDPYGAKHVCVVYFSYFLGLLDGAMLCRRFFPFETRNVTKKVCVLRGILGTILLLLLVRGVLQAIFNGNADFKFEAFISFVIGLSLTFGYPLLFPLIDKLCKR